MDRMGWSVSFTITVNFCDKYPISVNTMMDKTKQEQTDIFLPRKLDIYNK